MQAEELTEKTLDVKSLEDEHVLLKEAVEMALDDENPGEFYLEEINNLEQARRNNLGELESEWQEIASLLCYFCLQYFVVWIWAATKKIDMTFMCKDTPNNCLYG